MYRRIIMSRDEYQIRAAFKATYGFHKAKNKPNCSLAQDFQMKRSEAK